MTVMYDYIMIDSDAKLDRQLTFWRSHGITTVAMDFEGEFNLHIYGEHLCLVQIYDGAGYFLVDPLAVSPEALKRLLEHEDLEKVMFDCASDAALVRKRYGITLKRVHDVRVTAMLLGFDGNLSALTARCLNLPLATGKKGNQTANWLVRPLNGKLIEYALSDVEHLFAIREVLGREVAVAGLAQKDCEAQKNAALPKGPDRPGWEKLNGYRYLSSAQKVYARWFFEARDMLAQKLNVPAVRVLDKRVLVDLARHVPKDASGFREKANHRDKAIENELIALLVVASEGAGKEIEARLPGKRNAEG